MGQLIDLNSTIPANRIDPAIATDAEFQAADAAERVISDAKYQSLLPVSVVQQQVNAPAQISIVANTWFALGNLVNLNSGNSESLFAMSLYIQYIIGGDTQLYWQYSGCALVSPVWWKAGGGQLVKYVDMEGHAAVDFTLSFRFGVAGQGVRAVELYFPISLSARLIRATFVRLR